MSGCLQRVERRETGIPVPDPLSLIPGGFVHNIEAVACRAEKRAGATPDTFLMEPIPESRFHEGV